MITSNLSTAKSFVMVGADNYMPTNIQRDPPAGKFTQPRSVHTFKAGVKDAADTLNSGLDRLNSAILKYPRKRNLMKNVDVGKTTPYKLPPLRPYIRNSDSGLRHWSQVVNAEAAATIFKPDYSVREKPTTIPSIFVDSLTPEVKAQVLYKQHKKNVSCDNNVDRYIDDNVTYTSAYSQKKQPTNITELDVREPTKEIICPVYYEATAPLCDTRVHVSKTDDIETSDYINNDNVIAFNTNTLITYPKFTDLEAIDTGGVRVIQPLNIQQDTHKTGLKKWVHYDTDHLIKPPNRPSGTVDFSDTYVPRNLADVNTYDVQLRDTINDKLGSFDGSACTYIPTF